VAHGQFFAQPGVFLAWGLRVGQWSAEQIAQKAVDAGFKWLALECPDEEDYVLELRQACGRHHLYFGIWEVTPTSLDVLERTKPNFWILNVESPGVQYETLLPEFRAKHPLLPAAVVTNGDFDTAPFIKANVKAIPEAYVVDNPQATPAAMVYRMRQQGYTYVFPCLGVYHDYPLANYRLAGNGWSVYSAEGMHDEDWTTAARWNGKG
jgi:hypothetical protein